MDQWTTGKLQLSYVPGYFQHDTQVTGPESGFRATTLPSLGLLARSYPTDSEYDPEGKRTQWERFTYFMRDLNKQDQNAKYRVVYLQRHGEGFHNVKEDSVGRQEWEKHWARQTGDGNMVWEDAKLTPRGQEEAATIAKFWEDAMAKEKIQPPDQYFSSPLTRCIQTARITYGALAEMSGGTFELQVSEGLREIYGIHTCDRHGSRADLQSAFDFVRFDDDVPTVDDAWQPDLRELPDHAEARLRSWLERRFRVGNDTFISATTHTGAIRAIYRAIGHPDVWVARGSLTPLLVRETVSGGQS
ncbi:putative phosphoglycerate mutase pmu1 [Elasticomyces elasticus]|nr:putative phosphoglycerate mutase pmu1 [Elasticomyces elasticus]